MGQLDETGKKMIRNNINFLFGILALAYLSMSHVGSPGVIFEGMMGEYRVLANVAPPDVIPGIAIVSVILPDNPEGIQLEARPVYWSAGLQGTPTADVLKPVLGEPGKYEGELWFMQMGASSVQLILTKGPDRFEAVVPIMAMPTAQKDMPKELGMVLTGLGVFLVILLVTIFASAMGDSIRQPGEARNPKGQRKRVMGTAVGAVVVGLLLWGGKAWWDAEARLYNERLYQPFSGTSTWVEKTDGNYLHLKVDSTELTYGAITRQLSYMVPDHGKLMHLFLIRKNELDVFAHLHPKRIDSLNYKVQLPPLPAGAYHVFADITRYTGFAETIVSELIIPESTNFQLASNRIVQLGRDDTYTFSNPVGNKPLLLDGDIMVCGKPGIKTDLPGGYSAIWETETGKFEAGRLYSLDFALFDAYGQAAQLESYLGMMGHAVVLKHDGSVFIHLHPTGTYSMGSQQMLLERFETGKTGFGNLPGKLTFLDSVDRVVAYLDALPDATRDSLLMGDMQHLPYIDAEHEDHSMVRFPYAFPQPGDYRIWIQVKINGEIINGAFDVEVI
ncbi:hypothetical protein [Mongoliitalea lutea]|uniref:Uncharacterized protein n=2 Tax=Mongoliitalea lutea TaxID=849756 RepID=A0A8J3CXC8_9BACT|nr:hypothetical protein [Mongoliitalea lutea]GHB30184.1 hypothetical protein GCM10008106_08830 [Mongoliitalea lutea]